MTPLDPIHYNEQIDISTMSWKAMLDQFDIFTKKDITMLERMYHAPNHMLHAKEIAIDVGYSHHAPVNRMVSSLAKRVCKYMKINPPLKNRRGRYEWWHVLFLGRYGKRYFYWIMRPELIAAYKEYRSAQGEGEAGVPSESITK